MSYGYINSVHLRTSVSPFLPCTTSIKQPIITSSKYNTTSFLDSLLNLKQSNSIFSIQFPTNKHLGLDHQHQTPQSTHLQVKVQQRPIRKKITTMKLSICSAFGTTLMLTSIAGFSHAAMPHKAILSAATRSMPDASRAVHDGATGVANIARTADSSELMRRGPLLARRDELRDGVPKTSVALEALDHNNGTAGNCTTSDLKAENHSLYSPLGNLPLSNAIVGTADVNCTTSKDHLENCSHGSLRNISSSDITDATNSDVEVERRGRYTYYEVLHPSNRSDGTSCADSDVGVERRGRYTYYEVLHPSNSTNCASNTTSKTDGIESANTKAVATQTITVSNAAVQTVAVLNGGSLVGLLIMVVGLLLL